MVGSMQDFISTRCSIVVFFGLSPPEIERIALSLSIKRASKAHWQTVRGVSTKLGSSTIAGKGKGWYEAMTEHWFGRVPPFLPSCYSSVDPCGKFSLSLLPRSFILFKPTFFCPFKNFSFVSCSVLPLCFYFCVTIFRYKIPSWIKS